MSLREPSEERVSGVIIEDVIGELGFDGEVGSFVLPLAICWAHFASSRDFALDPGGLPTEKETIKYRKISFELIC